ncbi:Mov34/MPN/PAD-1 family protein [Halococcoides cellulosivorans]|uniref:Proteasome protein n=1 Tax=Halococcoides cellulosivorans TaxID=1679096 RepID=A0A2R4X1R5_9EURY|nr:Mov34/MPN/PAD-1 family protein [Halococcoides cellulosivorans]AWB27673.1 proteasome protein [Halococcoides cellulosivorans]
MRPFRPGEVVAIAESALEFAMEASRDSHPDEYMGLLRGDDARQVGLDRDGTVLTDVLVIPGTETNSVSATVKTSMVPNDTRAAGSIHSHPNGVLRPSAADRAAFGRGRVHIIMGAPYERGDWQAFDREGDPIELPVVEVDAPEEQFFDFDQHDIDEELREEGRLSETTDDAEDSGWLW